MPDIALYYAYTHIRDEAWLKAAALYLPRLGLIAPAGYPSSSVKRHRPTWLGGPTILVARQRRLDDDTMRHGTGCLDGAVQIVSVEEHAGMKGSGQCAGRALAAGKSSTARRRLPLPGGHRDLSRMPISGAAMSAVMLTHRRQPWSYTADGMLIEPNPAPAFHEHAA